MKVQFSKYQGAGNDFIMLDNRDGRYDCLTFDDIRFLCHRKFGIGADGLIKINSIKDFDFEADYYNADGSKSFCGNGGRCAVAFTKKLAIIGDETTFLGYDGLHKASIVDGLIQLEMMDVTEIQQTNNDYVIYTGSPHYIHFVESNATFDIYDYGKSIRYNETYKQEGINVNSVQVLGSNELSVRTYERGVENETLACGTGVTAAAIAYAHQQQLTGEQIIKIQVLGGELSVRFAIDEGIFSNVWLIGPGTHVFSGEIRL
jgi:diaminopimelate epimerase